MFMASLLSVIIPCNVQRIQMSILYKYYIHKYMNEDKSNKYTKQLSNQFIFLLGSLGIGTAKD